MRISDKKRLIDSCQIDYRPFLEVHTRSSSTKHVLIIKGNKLDSFLTTILSDTNGSDTEKLGIALLLSGGMRISELLHLQRNNVEELAEGTYITCKVLKKQRLTYRQFLVHPLIVPLLNKVCSSKRGYDKLVTYNRFALLYRIKGLIGQALDLHSLRHSYISYLAFTQDFSAEKISTLQEMNLKTVQTYMHIDQVTTLKDIYSGKSA